MCNIRRWISRCLVSISLLSISLLVSLPASAYLEFTYKSPVLPLVASYNEGYPVDISDYELPPVSFIVSFKTPEQDLSLKPVTHFFMDEFEFTFISEHDQLYYPLRFSPASYGRVSLNREGEILGWNLMITITELLTPETNWWAYRNINHRVDITSRGGDNLCNCDLYTNQFHPTTWHGQWIQLVALKFEYSNTNDVGNWTIEKIAVPEPASAGLLLTGLLGLFGLRRIRYGDEIIK
ncbi:MAG TPA: PEP-CTERM sorting domain-containing protein [Cellvibrio sp.]|nr:PEP-CTERM sorting domain-containing protein [Cellvibrio sp.]